MERLNRAFNPCDNCPAPKDLAEQYGLVTSMDFKNATNLASQMISPADVGNTLDEEVDRAMRLTDVPDELRDDVAACSRSMVEGSCQREHIPGIVTINVANNRL